MTDDFTAPTVTATNLQRTATSGWKNAAVSVKLRGADGKGGSGVAAVYYTVDGGDTQTYSGAFRVSDAGTHKVQVLGGGQGRQHGRLQDGLREPGPRRAGLGPLRRERGPRRGADAGRPSPSP